MKFNKAFTLIELLVVIGIMAVLAAGVVTLIDPVDKTNQANDARVQSTVADVATASEAYAAQHSGCYTSTTALLNSAGELKNAAPSMPTGYAVTITATTGTCTAPEATSIVVSVPLKAKKYSATPFWKYESTTGKSCAAATAATACP
jgi:prepilin-type N-terminal cleavage/methylation domain-containing protein